MPQKGISQNAWQCNVCKDGPRNCWMYPNKPACINCSRPKPKSPLFYSQTTEGKAAAAKSNGGNGGGGGGNGAKGGGGSFAKQEQLIAQQSKQIAQLLELQDGPSAVAAKENARLQKVIASKDRAIERLWKMPGDADMDDSSGPPASAGRTTSELEAERKQIEAKRKKMEEMLKHDPGDSDLEACVESLKKRHEAKQQEILLSKDPEDRLRGNHERRRRLKTEVESLTTKMHEAAEEAEEAEKRADACYQTFLQHNQEIDRLRVEERSISSTEAQPINSAADVSTIFEELRGNYEARFADPTLPEAILAQKEKTSGLLTQMGELLRALSQVDVGIQQAAKAEEQKSATAAEAAAKAATSAAVAAAAAPPPAAKAPAAPPPKAAPPEPVRSSGQKGARDGTEEVRVARRKAMAVTGAVVAVPGAAQPNEKSTGSQLAIGA